MAKLRSEYGGPAGIVATFGRLAPRSLVRPGTKPGTGLHQLADPTYCSTLSGTTLASEFERVIGQLTGMWYTTGFGQRTLAVSHPAPEPWVWCRGAPAWVLQLLEEMDAVECPEKLVGLPLESIPRTDGVGVLAALLFLHHIEAAWGGGGMDAHVGIWAIGDSGREPEPAWGPDELREQARRLLERSGDNLPCPLDLRFRDRLKAAGCGEGAVRELLESIAAGRCPTGTLAHKCRVVAGIQSAMAMTAQQEIADISIWTAARHFDASYRERNQDLFGHRYGIHGDSKTTLANVGERYSLTRERVRQIVALMRGAAHKQPIWAPACGAALSACHAALPGSAALIESKPHIKALLGEHLKLENLQRFSVDILQTGRRAEKLKNLIANSRRTGDVLVSSRGHVGIAAEIYRNSRTMICHAGAAQADWIAARVTKKLQRVVTDDDVIDVLRGARDFEWLSEVDGWFWFGLEGKNRLANRLGRMLAVARETLSIEELYGGLIRSDRDRRPTTKRGNSTVAGMLPPALVVLEVTKRLPFADVNGHNRARASKGGPQPEDVLGEVDLEIYRSLIELGGIASRRDVRERVLARTGGPKVNFEVLLADAPFILQLAPSVYSLRGHRIDPEKLLTVMREVEVKAKTKAEAAANWHRPPQ